VQTGNPSDLPANGSESEGGESAGPAADSDNPVDTAPADSGSEEPLTTVRAAAPTADARPVRRKDPVWARLSIAFGALVMLASVMTVAVPKMAVAWFAKDIPIVKAIPSELVAEDIEGPINLLLLGMDQRNGIEAEDRIRADSIILVHISADHKHIFMISIPRDSRVRIPPYPATGYKGGYDKINAAFAVAAVTPKGHRDPSQEGRTRGAELTIRTISNLVPGGLQWRRGH
jgi:hypothetical protein